MKLEDKAVEAIDKIMATSENALAFITEQSPEVARQLIAYRFADAVFGVVFGLLAMLFVFNLILMIKRKSNWVCDSDGEVNGAGLIAIVFGVVFLIIGFISVISGVSTIIKVSLAPNLYILEYAAGLVK